MAILIECAPSETDWQEIKVGEWLQHKDEAIANLANWSAKRLLDRFDMRLCFRSGDARLYGYFPFVFEISANAPQAEIGEVEGPDQVIELLVEQVAPDWRGRITMSFMAEQSGVPKELDLGADERNLALFLVAVFVRRRKSTAIPAIALPSRADLDKSRQTGKTAPIFVVGSGRCGSSVLTWALGQHPNIMPLDETGWLPMTLYGATAAFRMASAPKQNFTTEYDVSLDDFLQYIGSGVDRLHHTVARSHAQTDFLRRLSGRADRFDSAFQRVRTNWSPKQRCVDGTPLNTTIMPLLARAFPDAQFVAIIRDPRDVIASYLEFQKIGAPAYSIEEAAVTWLRAASMALRMRESLGSRRVMIVDHSEFTRPEELIRRIMRFLSEPNCASCVKPLQKRINSSNVAESIRKTIKGSRIDECCVAYDQIRAGALFSSVNWPDIALQNNDQWLDDLINRLIRAIS